jgi:hypothetical protein
MPTINLPMVGGDPFTMVYQQVQVTGRSILRPTRVEGTVRAAIAGALPAAMFPLALYPDAVASGALAAITPDDMPFGYDRGHLLGIARGGPNHYGNLVPIPHAINIGAWAQFEADMGAAPPLANHHRYMRVDLAYGDPNQVNPTIPNRVQGWAYRLPTIAGAPARTAALSAAIAAGGALIAAGGNLIHATGILNFAAADNAPFVFIPAQRNALLAVRAAYAAWGAPPTVGGGNTGGTLNGGRGDPPAGTTMGPYAFLDVVETSPALRAGLNAAFPLLNYPPAGVIKRNRQSFAVTFTAPQRELIRLVNRWNNNGRLSSDNAWYDHNMRLDSNRTQIDHIIPIGFLPASSSNFYWNAQVTSAEYNRTKGKQSEAGFLAAHQAAPRVLRHRLKRTNFYTPY